MPVGLALPVLGDGQRVAVAEEFANDRDRSWGAVFTEGQGKHAAGMAGHVRARQRAVAEARCEPTLLRHRGCTSIKCLYRRKIEN